MRIPCLPSPRHMKVNDRKIDFSYDQDKKEVRFDLDEQKAPDIHYDLAGEWNIKDEDFQKEAGSWQWRIWNPWKPLENYGFLRNGYSWYRTSFNISDKSKPLFLILTGFQDEASIYLNKKYIGSGINRFKKELSSLIELGKNELMICLESVGHSCMGYKTFNGITHPVYISYDNISFKLKTWKLKAVSNRIYQDNELTNEIQPEAGSNYNDDGWKSVIVDWNYDSRLSKSEDEERFCWYRKEVQVPRGCKGKNLSLDFKETIEDAYIYVNNEFIKVERNTGLNLPFSVDITSNIKTGEKNNISIGVKAGRGCLLFGLHKQVKISAHDLCLDGNWEICEKLSGQRKGWFETGYDDTSWDRIPKEKKAGRRGGIVWYRKKIHIEVPQDYVAPLRLTLKDTYSKALIYFNGILIGRYADIGPQEDFYIYEDIIKKENVIAIAVDGRDREPELGKISISAYYAAKKVDIELLL